LETRETALSLIFLGPFSPFLLKKVAFSRDIKAIENELKLKQRLEAEKEREINNLQKEIADLKGEFEVDFEEALKASDS